MSTTEEQELRAEIQSRKDGLHRAERRLEELEAQGTLHWVATDNRPAPGAISLEGIIEDLAQQVNALGAKAAETTARVEALEALAVEEHQELRERTEEEPKLELPPVDKQIWVSPDGDHEICYGPGTSPGEMQNIVAVKDRDAGYPESTSLGLVTQKDATLSVIWAMWEEIEGLKKLLS